MITVHMKNFKPNWKDKLLAKLRLRNYRSVVDKLCNRIEKINAKIGDIDRDIEELKFYRERMLAERARCHQKLNVTWKGQ